MGPSGDYDGRRDKGEDALDKFRARQPAGGTDNDVRNIDKQKNPSLLFREGLSCERGLLLRGCLQPKKKMLYSRDWRARTINNCAIGARKKPKFDVISRQLGDVKDRGDFSGGGCNHARKQRVD